MNEPEWVPSPGGWEAPEHVLPMWNWTPPGGGSPRVDRAPRWARLWYRTPFIDRFAHAWLWRHGGWDVLSRGCVAAFKNGDIPESFFEARADSPDLSRVPLTRARPSSRGLRTSGRRKRRLRARAVLRQRRLR